MTRLTLPALFLAALAALWIASTSSAAGVPDPVGASADAPCEMRPAGATEDVNRAGLVVTFGGGRTESFCIEFTEDSITGMELLQRSGLPVVTDAFGGIGAAVCNIDGEGCDDPANCFCRCSGGQCQYWAYFQLRDGAWYYSPQGSGLRTVRDGDTDGWVWGPIGNGDGLPRGSAPPCAAPTATPQPAATPTPRPTRTPRPAGTATEIKPPVETPSVPPQAPPSTPSTPPPAPSTVAEVAGATAVPPDPTSAPPTRTPAAAGTPEPQSPSATFTPRATRTPSAGVVRVSPDEGEANARASSSPTESSGGRSYRGIATFSIVAVLLVAGSGLLLIRRRSGGDS